MAILYILRRPRFPVIVFVEGSVFHSLSSAAAEKLLGRELKAGVKVRLLDSGWSWFNAVDGEGIAIVPSIAQAPNKQALIDLVNRRTNRVEGDPSYERRSLSSRSREEIFQELLAILPAS